MRCLQWCQIQRISKCQKLNFTDLELKPMTIRKFDLREIIERESWRKYRYIQISQSAAYPFKTVDKTTSHI